MNDRADLLRQSKELIRNRDLDELSALFRRFRDCGGTQEVGESVISQCLSDMIREGVEEILLDEVRDFADTVYGWCNTESRIWPAIG